LAAISAARPGRGPSSALRPAGGGTAPLYFICNRGQEDARALFYARTPGYTVWLIRDGLIFDRIEKDKAAGTSRFVSGIVFKNANKNVEIAASDPSDYRVSYFYGRDEDEWITDIPASRSVLYKNLYDGIDLKVYGSGNRIEYDWLVAPGGRPEKIQFACSGPLKPSLDGEGNLAVESPLGGILHRKPRAHQVIGGRCVDVDAGFREGEDGSFGLTVGAYDRRCELAIDPLVLAYSTYLGGSATDYSIRGAVDPTGASYVGGYTESGDFPPAAETQIRKDIFISKISPDGRSLVYTAFFPSGASAENLGIDVDAKGFVYLAALTGSSKFPVKNAFQSKFGGGPTDGFVLKLAKNGRSLIYSSYIGGKGFDFCSAVVADSSGAAYVGGYTGSSDYPIKKAYQKSLRGSVDAFIAKVAPSGNSLDFSTFFGSSGKDYCTDLAVDGEGRVTVVGPVYGFNLPLKSPFQKTFGGGNGDGFVARFSAAGDRLVFSSYLGGANYDEPAAVALDGSGAVYITGYTTGNFPLKNAFQKARKGGREVFVTKIDPAGKGLVYSSYLGGTGNDAAIAIAVDGDGSAYLAGYTQSRNFPVKSPLQASLRGSLDCFLAIVDPGGRKLLSSTYWGGSYRDWASGLAIDAGGNIYLSGQTNSLDFQVLDPFQESLGGRDDAFVIKFSSGTD